MTIRRCAWHPQYFGRELVIEAIDDGEDMTTDGMCEKCRARWLAEEEQRQNEQSKTTDAQ